MSIERVEYCNNFSSDTHILLNRTDEYEFYETGQALQSDLLGSKSDIMFISSVIIDQRINSSHIACICRKSWQEPHFF